MCNNCNPTIDPTAIAARANAAAASNGHNGTADRDRISPALDTAAIEAFGERLVGMLNASSLALMISIGHRTGLFDTMAALDAPATSEEIADAARTSTGSDGRGGMALNERYVREWLGAMTTGGIVRLDASGERYWLPAEHAALLRSDAGADNLGGFMQYIGILGSVEDRIVDCFRAGGGVGYDEFPRFHEVMRADSEQWGVAPLFDRILPAVPGIEARLEAGIDVADCGCGSGRALVAMARRYPRSRFTGYDLSPEAIGYARNLAAEFALKNIAFEVRDLTTFDRDAPEGAFDFVTTFDAVHDQARPDRLLAGIRRSLRPGGIYLMIDIAGASRVADNLDHPMGPFIYTISCMHCMTVSLAQGGLGVGAMWGRELAERMLGEAGFAGVEVKELEHDQQNYYYIVRK